MDCIKNNKRGAEIVTSYCAGTLEPAATEAIETHILECSECRTVVEAQRTVWRMLETWAPIEVSSNFDAQLYARIAREQSGPAWLGWLRRLFQPATPLPWWKAGVSLIAAGAALTLALVAIPHLPDRTDVAQHKATMIQSATASGDIDLQQVQQALDDIDMLAPSGQSASSKL